MEELDNSMPMGGEGDIVEDEELQLPDLSDVAPDSLEAAKQFNRDLSGWNTMRVTNMKYMFKHANAFNDNISNWKTSIISQGEEIWRAFRAPALPCLSGMVYRWPWSAGALCRSQVPGARVHHAA